MANIEKIVLPDNTEYDVKDANALPKTAGATEMITGNLFFDVSESGKAINFRSNGTDKATVSSASDTGGTYCCNLKSDGTAKNGFWARNSSTDSNQTETIVFSNGGYVIFQPNGPGNQAKQAFVGPDGNFAINGSAIIGGATEVTLACSYSSGGNIILRPNGATNSNGQFWIDKSGYIHSSPTYNHTTTSSANLVVGSGGDFYRNSSLRQYKTDIASVTEEDAEKGYELNPITFVSAIEDDDKHTQYGFIAEEVHEVLPNLNTYDGDGEVVGVAYERVCAILLKQNQMLKARVDTLEERLAKLEEK